MSLHFKKSGIQHEIIFFFNEEQHFKKTPNNSSHKLLAEYRELTAGLGGCSLSPCSWRWAAVSPQHTPQTASWKLSPLLWWSRWGAHTHRAAHKGRKREQSVSNPQPSRPREAQGKTNYKIASQTDARSQQWCTEHCKISSLKSNGRSKEKIGHYPWIATIKRIWQCKCFLHQCSNL